MPLPKNAPVTTLRTVKQALRENALKAPQPASDRDHADPQIWEPLGKQILEMLNEPERLAQRYDADVERWFNETGGKETENRPIALRTPTLYATLHLNGQASHGKMAEESGNGDSEWAIPPLNLIYLNAMRPHTPIEIGQILQQWARESDSLDPIHFSVVRT